MLQLKRPLIVFDLETTGVNISEDAIIEFAYIKIMPDGLTMQNQFLIDPMMPIPEEITMLTGISDELVRGKPKFSDMVDHIKSIFDGCDVAGYNSNNFDVPILIEECLRCGVEIFAEDTLFVDACTIFKKKEERTLKAAVKFFLNKEFEDAHHAGDDTLMTKDVLLAEIDRYPDIGNTVEELAKFSEYENAGRVDYAGKLIKNAKGQICYNIGKAKGVPVEEDLGFGKWMLLKEFPLDTLNKLRKIMNDIYNKETNELANEAALVFGEERLEELKPEDDKDDDLPF